MGCNSVPAGETPTPITPEQQKNCAHLGHSEKCGPAAYREEVSGFMNVLVMILPGTWGVPG
jgi:hypothetical protein